MLWQSIKQWTQPTVQKPVSDGSVWLWHQLSFPKESNSSFALGRRSFCIGLIGILTSLFSLQALIAIPSCPDSCWIPATSPQPPEEMERFALVCSFSFYLFLNIFVYCASSLSSALQWASWLESASHLLLDRRVVFCSDPLHHSLTELPLPWLFWNISFSFVRWSLAFISGDPYQPALQFTDFSVWVIPCLLLI